MPEPQDTKEYLAKAAEEREQARREALESEAWKDGIVGDPDAPLGYVVDPNHRPDPAHMGSVDTTGINGWEYDLKRHTGIFDGGTAIEERAVETGHDPSSSLEVSEDLHPAIAASLEGYVPPSPEPPPPAGTTDYSADLSSEGNYNPERASEIATERIPEGLMADPALGANLGNQPVVPGPSGTTLYGPDPTHGAGSESGYTETQEEEGNQMRTIPEEEQGAVTTSAPGGPSEEASETAPETPSEPTGERPAEPGPGDPTQPPTGAEEPPGGPPAEEKVVTQADAGGSIST